jgi:hypothetical protein
MILSTALVALLGASAAAVAPAATVACGGLDYAEARSLKNLPPEIQAALGAGAPGRGGIADRGERFNSSDVVDEKVPARRFAAGGFAPGRAVVFVERGGFADRIEAIQFSIADGKASVTKRWPVAKKPADLAAACAAAPRKAPSKRPAPARAPGDAPGRSQQHYLAGVVQYQKGDYDAARREWKKALDLDPSNDDARIGLDKLDKLFGVPAAR